jgi:hypothetical protein
MITGNYELTLSEENLKISRKAKLSKGKKKKNPLKLRLDHSLRP